MLTSRRRALQIFALACACVPAGAALAQTPTAKPGQKWICPPCGCSADDKEFDAPGQCPACGYALIPKPDKPKDAPAPKANGGSFFAG